MIDFNNAAYIKLNLWDRAEAAEALAGILLPDEKIYASFKGVRDSVTFTDKRIIALNVQGITGRKKDYTSLPYSRIQTFSVETPGTFDLDCELELWFSGLGKVKLEFGRSVNIRQLQQYIANKVLQ